MCFFAKKMGLIENAFFAKMGTPITRFSFTKHFKASSLLCKRLSGWILRTFRTLCHCYVCSSYQNYVELNMLASCGTLIVRKTFENVERGFTKHIKNVAHLDQGLQLYSLQSRRKRYCMIYVCKILEGHVLNLTDSVQSRFFPRVLTS